MSSRPRRRKRLPGEGSPVKKYVRLKLSDRRQASPSYYNGRCQEGSPWRLTRWTRLDRMRLNDDGILDFPHTNV